VVEALDLRHDDRESHSRPSRPVAVLGWTTGGHTTSVFQQATRANSASYPQRAGKWVPAYVRWRSAAGE